MMEELKKAHEGKRVDDGITFDTKRFTYRGPDKSTFGLNYLQDFVCPYCFQVGELKATAFTYWKECVCNYCFLLEFNDYRI